jgi:hypothetical protein
VRRQGPRATQEVVDLLIRQDGGGTLISHDMPVERLVVTEAVIGVVSGAEAGKLLHGTSNGDTQGGVFALSFSVRSVPG